MRLATMDTDYLVMDGQYPNLPEKANPENKDSRRIGFCLGFDFCAEHEWGTARMREELGLPEKVERFTDTIIPANNVVQLVQTKKGTALVLLNQWARKKPDEEVTSFIKNHSFREETRSFIAAWDSNSFMIYGRGEKPEKFVRRLYDAMIAGNISIQQSSGIFGRGGLCFYFVNEYPLSLKKEFDKSCEDRRNMIKAAFETGIEKRLDDARNASSNSYRSDKFGRFALSPAWKNKDNKTKYPVIFWLNPVDQDRNNYGWFTVEELDQWIEGTGPVPKANMKEKV